MVQTKEDDWNRVAKDIAIGMSEFRDHTEIDDHDRGVRGCRGECIGRSMMAELRDFSTRSQIEE